MTNPEFPADDYEKGARLEPSFLAEGTKGVVIATDDEGEVYRMTFIGRIAEKNSRHVLRLMGIVPAITYPVDTFEEHEVVVKNDVIKKRQVFQLESDMLLANSAFRADEIFRELVRDQPETVENSPELSSPSE